MKRNYPQSYDDALNNCPDADKIKEVFATYPDDDSIDGRESHNLLALDAGTYESLSAPVEEIETDVLRTGFRVIAEFIVKIGVDSKGMEIALCAAAGNSLNQIAAFTGIPRDTIRSRLEKMRRDFPEIGEAIYKRKSKGMTRFPGGVTI